MTFRPRDRSKPRKPQSPAQEAATERSFRIFRLRGLWSQCLLLTGERREAAQAAVDAELDAMGAEPEGERQAANRTRWERIDAAEAARADMEKDLPF
ncbi:MAG: hypothetical protein VX755_12380 [Pseudomonadota bacterium]|jgi:hypothetical protein|nr:hypothetical protein [Pseudomonadota bacterium]MED5538675.1 hypothetical protein [Pseudomonadota bacterium]